MHLHFGLPVGPGTHLPVVFEFVTFGPWNTLLSFFFSFTSPLLVLSTVSTPFGPPVGPGLAYPKFIVMSGPWNNTPLFLLPNMSTILSQLGPGMTLHKPLPSSSPCMWLSLKPWNDFFFQLILLLQFLLLPVDPGASCPLFVVHVGLWNNTFSLISFYNSFS
jgi:hypothetical protein